MADTINMPKLGFDMAEGILVRWVKKVGENISKGDVLAEIETDKATVEVESSASGVLRKLLVDEGAVVPVSSPIAIVGTAEEAIQEPGNKVSGNKEESKASERVVGDNRHGASVSELPSAAGVQQPAIRNPQSAILKASPLAKKIARERNLDLSHIQGTGPGGRIVRRDIEGGMLGQPETASGQAQESFSHPPSGVDETINLSKLRQAIARRMAESKASIPHFYVSHEYKMDALMEMRSQYNQIVVENEKLSVNDFIVKAVGLTLRQFPNLNASLNGNSVLRHGQANIGIAVSVEGGLLTIVCREADQKPLRQISAEVKAMAARVREGVVKPADIEGSTFSISNMGMFDVENFSAIINPPEAAILAVGSARQVPVVEGGALKIGWRMKATISVDHRVSDGVEAAKFMQALAACLEEPLRLII
ncbi:MAG: dihydrolipoamide acetyltransferase family protein [Anaerolineales bacterium]|jgi:pyruvate dehydrogenase E2 component (dihydrolipoamide acetyltransferase)